MNGAFLVSLVVIAFLCGFIHGHEQRLKNDNGILFNWNKFKEFHDKQYSGPEDLSRKKLFVANSRKIREHNQKFAGGLSSYSMKMNHFGDMSHEEFQLTMNGFKHNASKSTSGAVFLKPKFMRAPDHIDWREYGYVTPVKNQGQCGSCWAFSACGALEGQHFRKSGNLVDLSEQNLVDCSGDYGNSGCAGGLMDYAFDYIRDNEGIDSEESYPYEARDGVCRFRQDSVSATDLGHADVLPSGSENQLKEAIATIGPISVAMDASPESFQFYSKGVYDEPACSSTHLNHGVLAIGFGTENGKDYWLVKNSWGEEWGDAGYVKMTRNRNNQCGIATSASYPLV